ncbi:MAG: exonuclease SbcCD subunit D [Dermatophilaceae bacterium]
MRFLHTSDWHLGRAFNGVRLLDAQARVLDHLVETAREARVDAVLVAGDVYDKALPNPDAVVLLSQTLERLVDLGARVVVTSGNHDSAIRLGFASGLLARAGLHVRTGLEGLCDPVLVGDAAIYALPYLEPTVVADVVGAQTRTHAGVLRTVLGSVREDAGARGRPAVVMAHAFVTGGAGCESERDISVGGVGSVDPALFDDFDYAALGHLHGRQRVGESVHYSGSPIAMSFGEVGHVKGYSVVEVESGRAPRVDLVCAPVDRPLALLRGRLEDLLGDPRHTSAERAWVAVVLTDSVRPLGAMDRIRRRFPHAIRLDWAPEGGVEAAHRTYAARVADRSDLDICCDFLAHVRGGVASGPRERTLLREAVGGARVARAGADDEGGVRPDTTRGAVA